MEQIEPIKVRVNKNKIIFRVGKDQDLVIELPVLAQEMRWDHEIGIFYSDRYRAIRLFDAEDEEGQEGILGMRLMHWGLMLKKLLDGELKLHPSIQKNIGYLASKLIHKRGMARAAGKAVDDNDSDLHYERDKQGTKYWVGADYEFALRYDTATWLYEKNGKYFLEITPTYIWHFIKDGRNKEGYVSYDKFMKNYQPIATIELKTELVKEWMLQIMALLKNLETTRAEKQLFTEELFISAGQSLAIGLPVEIDLLEADDKISVVYKDTNLAIDLVWDEPALTALFNLYLNLMMLKGGQRKLHPSIQKNIGYLANKALLKMELKQEADDNELKYEMTEEEGLAWVGQKYAVWGPGHAEMAWLYEKDERFFLEITPVYPWIFQEGAHLQEGYVPFEEYIQDYKTTVIIELETSAIDALVDQVDELLAIMRDNDDEADADGESDEHDGEYESFEDALQAGDTGREIFL
jgi:hypothetical protein